MLLDVGVAGTLIVSEEPGGCSSLGRQILDVLQSCSVCKCRAYISAQYVPVGTVFVFLVKQLLPAGGVTYWSQEEIALSG